MRPQLCAVIISTKVKYQLILLVKRQTDLIFFQISRKCHSTGHIHCPLQCWGMEPRRSKSICARATLYETASDGPFNIWCRITLMHWKAICSDGNQNEFSSFTTSIYSVTWWTFGGGFQITRRICHTTKCCLCQTQRAALIIIEREKMSTFTTDQMNL